MVISEADRKLYKIKGKLAEELYKVWDSDYPECLSFDQFMQVIRELWKEFPSQDVGDEFDYIYAIHKWLERWE